MSLLLTPHLTSARPSPAPPPPPHPFSEYDPVSTPPYTHYVIASSSPRAAAALQATRCAGFSMNERGALSGERRSSPGIWLQLRFRSRFLSLSLSLGSRFRRRAGFSCTHTRTHTKAAADNYVKVVPSLANRPGTGGLTLQRRGNERGKGGPSQEKCEVALLNRRWAQNTRRSGAKFDTCRVITTTECVTGTWNSSAGTITGIKKRAEKRERAAPMRE